MRYILILLLIPALAQGQFKDITLKYLGKTDPVVELKWKYDDTISVISQDVEISKDGQKWMAPLFPSKIENNTFRFGDTLLWGPMLFFVLVLPKRRWLTLLFVAILFISCSKEKTIFSKRTHNYKENFLYFRVVAYTHEHKRIVSPVRRWKYYTL